MALRFLGRCKRSGVREQGRFAQPREYAKNHGIVHFKKWGFYDVRIISQQQQQQVGKAHFIPYSIPGQEVQETPRCSNSVIGESIPQGMETNKKKKIPLKNGRQEVSSIGTCSVF